MMRAIRSYLRESLSTMRYTGPVAFLDCLPYREPDKKEDWGFIWQGRKWSRLYSTRRGKAKVHQYWLAYRHFADMVSISGIDSKSRILDIGCGISTVLDQLPGERYGIDPIASRYKTVYSYPPDIAIFDGFGESLPFRDGYFDLVTCSNCIDHVADPAATFREIRRALKPSGHLFLTCEVYDTDIGFRNVAHPHSLTVPALNALLGEAGFKPVAEWSSPWTGLRNYVLGLDGAGTQEHIWIARLA